jgi:hypothetical protein
MLEAVSSVKSHVHKQITSQNPEVNIEGKQGKFPVNPAEG